MPDVQVQLHQFETRQSDDDVKTDLELTCAVCGEHLCDIEDGDTLGALAGVAADHVAKGECKPHMYSCLNCGAGYDTPDDMNEHINREHPDDYGN